MSFLNKLFGGTQASGATAMNAAEAKTMIDSANPPYLLDVREANEYREGHIPGARLLPLGELGKKLDELPRDREILVICRSGNRSGMATRQLLSAGYKAINLTGGMIDWQRSGFPIRRDK